MTTSTNIVSDYYDIIPETTNPKKGGTFNSDNLVRVKYVGDAYLNMSQDIADQIRYLNTNNEFVIGDNNNLSITKEYDWCNNEDYVATGIRTKTFQVIESLDYLDRIIADFTKTIPLYKIIKNKVSMVGLYETTIHDIRMNTFMNNDGKCITTVILLYSKNKYYLTDKKISNNNNQSNNESNNQYGYTSQYSKSSYLYDNDLMDF